MADFFEKLKKGMDVSESIEEPIEEPMIEEPIIELTSIKTEESEIIEEKPEKKRKKVKKTKKIEAEEQKEKPKEPKEESVDLFDGPEGELTVDVYQKGKELIIQSAIAGIDPEDLDIAIEDDLLIIKGKREKMFAEENEDYFFQECYWGRFKREILLPVDVDSSKISAKLEKGILTIKVPVIERESKTKISVK